MKGTLNLEKIRLYCNLSGIEDWQEVPRCSNCKHKNNTKDSCQLHMTATLFKCEFSSHRPYGILTDKFKYRKHEEDSKSNEFVFRGCDKWEQRG
jgi:hypothetical protein